MSRTTGNFVVCDRGGERSRMQIFSPEGHFLHRITIRYIDIVAGLAISPSGLIVAVDSVTPTVFFIRESGTLEKWFECSQHMSEPSDIAVAGNEYFICDFKVWPTTTLYFTSLNTVLIYYNVLVGSLRGGV